MSPAAGKYPKAAGRVFVVSSPSGGGKTTVVRAVLQRVPGLSRSVSVTTRARRPEERAGRDYAFVSDEAFARLRREGQLLEWAQVHQALYGTPRASVERVLRAGRDVILSIDVQGAEQVRQCFGDRSVLVFLVPPSMRDLRVRLIGRRTETPEAIRRRLEAAQRELACSQWYDYRVINRELGRAVAQLEAIIIAERLRVPQSEQGGRR
jgi:guanylate kinase